MSGKDKLISVEHLKWNVGGIKCGTLTVDYLNWILDHEEPAVDAVPVIRCKDCKYNSNTEGNYVNCDIIPQMFGKTPDDNYCSWAERRGEE